MQSSLLCGSANAHEACHKLRTPTGQKILIPMKEADREAL